MGEPILAIDYGTCQATAAVVADGRTELVREPASGARTWPSSVFVDEDNLIVGTLAERRKRLWPAAYRGDVKRDLGRDVPVQLGDRTFAPTELVTAVIDALKLEAEKIVGHSVRRAVITIPTSYGPGGHRRQLMIEAAEAAGFVDVDLLAEPIAAAWAPLVGDAPSPGDLLAVYDLGGGTFDATLIGVGEAGRHDLVDHASLHECGGRDLDLLLYEEIRALGGSGLESLLGGIGSFSGVGAVGGVGGVSGAGRVGGGFSDDTAIRTRLELADFARTVKHQLTDVEVVEDVFGPAGLLVTVDRARFTQLAAPMLARTLTCCLNLVTNAGTVPEKLAGVLVVGGSTRMPIVKDVLTGALDVGTGWTGQRLFTVADPELAIVEGTAAWAAAVGSRRASASRPTTVVQPARWEIPGEPATLVRWLVEPGVRYEADSVLARVRLPDGSLFDLTADAPGRLLHQQAVPGTPVTSADWLATTVPSTQQAAMALAQAELAASQEREAGPTRPVAVVARHTFAGHERDVTSCAFSPDGRLLATTCKDGTRLWDVATGRTTSSLTGRRGAVYGCAFSPDGRLLATTGSDKAIRIVDVLTERAVATLSGHKGPVHGCAFSPDGRLLATTSTDRTAKLWDVTSGAVVATFSGHRGSVYGCAFSPDGRLLVTTGAESVRLWDVAAGEETAALTGHTNWANGCAFSPDGKLFATTSNDGTRVWEVATLKTSTMLSGSAVSCAFSPDGQLLATASTDDIARIWDVDTGEATATLVGHTAGVMCCAFSPRNLLVATTSSDKTARLWELSYVP